MRLLTHNMLSSNIKGVTNGFPLRIQVEKVVEIQVEINHDFLRNIFPKIHWKAFSDASRIMGYNQLPEEPPEPSVDFLGKFHHALLELHLEEGALLCPQTGRKFPVTKGIPNMLLLEDELIVVVIRVSFIPNHTVLGLHFCGIREYDLGVECWGRNNSVSSVPKAFGFLAIASSDSTTCGVREVDLVLDCSGANKQSLPDYSPPLQLCSPGVCASRSCANGKFAFNASILNEPELTTLCAQNELKICLPCGTSCSEGYFPSSTCSANGD
ncbi:hypothetical protein V6N13_121173 [Hibiscus sabdariffa]